MDFIGNCNEVENLGKKKPWTPAKIPRIQNCKHKIQNLLTFDFLHSNSFFLECFLTKTVHTVSDSHIKSYPNFWVQTVTHSPSTSTSKKSELCPLVIPEFSNHSQPKLKVSSLLNTWGSCSEHHKRSKPDSNSQIISQLQGKFLLTLIILLRHCQDFLFKNTM